MIKLHALFLRKYGRRYKHKYWNTLVILEVSSNWIVSRIAPHCVEIVWLC